MNDILTPLMSALFGAGVGLVPTFLFYRSKQRKESVEATTMEFDALVAQLNYLKQQIKENFTDMDAMQNLLDKKRQDNIELSRRIGELEMKLVDEQTLRKKAEQSACLIRDCITRKTINP